MSHLKLWNFPILVTTRSDKNKTNVWDSRSSVIKWEFQSWVILWLNDTWLFEHFSLFFNFSSNGGTMCMFAFSASTRMEMPYYFLLDVRVLMLRLKWRGEKACGWSEKAIESVIELGNYRSRWAEPWKWWRGSDSWKFDRRERLTRKVNTVTYVQHWNPPVCTHSHRHSCSRAENFQGPF